MIGIAMLHEHTAIDTSEARARSGPRHSAGLTGCPLPPRQQEVVQGA
jgi:hypothetical protein